MSTTLAALLGIAVGAVVGRALARRFVRRTLEIERACIEERARRARDREALRRTRRALDLMGPRRN